MSESKPLKTTSGATRSKLLTVHVIKAATWRAALGLKRRGDTERA